MRLATTPEPTEAELEAATVAALQTMPSEFNGEIGAGELDRMIRAALLAAAKARGISADRCGALWPEPTELLQAPPPRLSPDKAGDVSTGAPEVSLTKP